MNGCDSCAVASLTGAATVFTALYGYSHLAGDLGLALGANVERWCRRIEALPGYIAGPGPYDPLAML